MFIRKRDYKMILARLNNLESFMDGVFSEVNTQVTNATESFDAKLYGFATDIDELRGLASDLDERTVLLENESEQLEKDRENERKVVEGMNSILGYGVKNGRSKTQ